MLFPFTFWLRPFCRGLGHRLCLGLSGSGLGFRVRGVHQVRDACLDRLVGGQLGLGVELEVALGPVKRVDHGIVARLAVTTLGMKKMSEEEVQRGGLPVPIADDKGTRRPLTLSGFEKRTKGGFGQ